MGISLGLAMIVIAGLLRKIANRDENKDMHLTVTSKEELKNWIKFRNYIKTYTLLKDKSFEEIILYERYIPFAMALNINKKYTDDMIRILGKKEVMLLIKNVKKYKRINNVFVEYYGD